MNKLALELTRKCYETKDPYLDLGMCGLTDDDFTEGSELDIALRKCKDHLEKLVLSNEWHEWDEWKKTFVLKNSSNKGPDNFFTTHPPAFLDLHQLTSLICSGGSWETPWEISDASFLEALTGLRSLDLSSNQISDISSLRSLIGLKSLDLHDNNISDISFLQTLTEVQNLDLRDNKISDISFLQPLINLQNLHLSINRISDISSLQPLVRLQSLSLRDNNISNYSFLQSLTKVENLDLRDNNISDISFLQPLTGLQTLYLSGNKISNISSLQSLSRLQNLLISVNQISDISSLAALTELQSVSLSANHISDISSFKLLTGLQSLNLSDNNISDISSLKALTGLHSLNLNLNQIADYSFIQSLTSLQSLNLNSNRITEIKNLNRLKNLNELRLANNEITELKNLGKLPQLEEIDLSGNPITKLDSLPHLIEQPILKSLRLFGTQSNSLGIPPEHFGKDADENCLEALRGYFASLKKGSFQLKELPVILVGNSTAGKTSLRYFLQQNIFPPPDDHSTHGIEPSIWHPDDETLENLDEAIKPKGLQLFFWDFGGQEYFHATHRLFFSKKAIYILVWEKKTNKQGIEQMNIRIKKPDGTIESTVLPVELFPYEYWLQSIRHLAGNIKDSPVILLQNKINETENDTRQNPDPGLLQNNNCEALQVSIKKAYEINGMGRKDPLVDLLLQKIFSEAKHLVSTLTYGAIWEDIKKMLQQVRNENIWTVDHFKEQVRLLDPELQDNSIMLSYVLSLHEIKSLLYIADDALLAKYVFVNPGWATEMIYHILDQSVLEKHGEFDHAHVRKKASDEYADIFIALMKKFELIFEYEESYDDEKLTKYVAPQYLPAELTDINKKIELKRRFTAFEKPGFLIGFKQFMPRYIMLRFLAAYGEKAVSKYYWKNGIAFMMENCSVLVLSDYDNKQFRMFTEDNNRYIERLVFDKLVALSENTKALSVAVGDSGFVDCIALSEEFPGGRPSGNKTIKSVNGSRVQLAPFAEFFEDIEVVKRKCMHAKPEIVKAKNVFISYAHDDIGYRQELQQFLVNLERDGLIEIWQDGLIESGEDWDRKIKEAMENADICILLLSQSLIASDYVHETEFRTIMGKRMSGTALIIPVLLKQCDWKNWKAYPQKVLDELKKEEKDYKISTFQFLPINAKKRVVPVNKWKDREDAWLQVAEAVRNFVTR